MTHSLPGCKAMAILFVWSQGSGSWQVGRAVLPGGTVSHKTCSECSIPHLASRGATGWVLVSTLCSSRSQGKFLESHRA